MVKVLLRLFLKNEDPSGTEKIRTRTSVFAGTLGIVCNIILFAIKFFAGIKMASIAIISDAFNNLSDIGTSMVSIIGAKLSAKKPDKEHPFGHGRIEYVSSLIVSFIIMLVGFELLKTSAAKIFAPQTLTLNIGLAVILCVSIPIKLWMYSYNKYLGNKINSRVLLATAKDSINDVFATVAVIIGTVFGKVFKIPWLDGAVGMIVSFVIMHSGFKISLDTVGLLLGKAPDKEIITAIREYLLNARGIEGAHDLIVHDYGPGRCLASVHAEVSDDCNVVEIHEIIDSLEQQIEAELGVHIVIHMDPISINCGKTENIREMVRGIVKSIDERMNIHDFRMTDGINALNLIFDVEVPSDFEDIDEAKKQITEKIKSVDNRFNTRINVDFIYE